MKIRGFRIELREISLVLAKHPAVRESVVLLRDDEPDNPRLVAYVIPYSQPERSLSYTPLFQVMFSLEKAPAEPRCSRTADFGVAVTERSRTASVTGAVE